jgi:diacylglycerol O-acyltransferase
MHYQEWGEGDPVIALHPLALESTAFAGVARLLADRGMRTLAADLPGFGQTPAGDEPLTARRLAEPVIEFARSLEKPAVLLGMSLGARVALEAALEAPGAFRGAALVVPYLPWLQNRALVPLAGLLNPDLAERIPIERGWPILKAVASMLESRPALEHDWLARASVRVSYNLACPATRRHFVSATREMALEPHEGPDSIWERMALLDIPSAFVWAERDWLIPAVHAVHVEEVLPSARQMRVPCSGHFVNGSHFRCFDNAMALAVAHVLEDSAARAPGAPPLFHADDEPERCPCVAGGDVEQSAPEAGDADMSTTHNEKRRLSAEDTVFVHGETATMPMHTIGTMILNPSTAPGGTLDFNTIVRAMASRVHLMKPFRQRLIEVPLALDRPMLVDDPDFRFEDHVQHVTLPAPGTLDDLAEFVGGIAGKPLDRSRPLWEMWVIEGLDDGNFALVTKLHHCMLDGASGASQMAGFLDLSPAPEPTAAAPPWNPPALPSRLMLGAAALIPHMPNPIPVARLVVRSVAGLFSRMQVERTCAAEGHPALSLLDRTPRTRFTRAITGNRAVAFGSADLADVKFIKNAFGVTVNDVMLAACAMAMRCYLAEHDDLPASPLLCAVPVSVKSEAEKQEFSNKVAMMTVRLPTHLEDPAEVLAAVHAESATAKKVFSAVEDDLALGWLELAPLPMIRLFAGLFSDWRLANWLPSLANLVVSNMPGPPIALYVAGAQVEAIYPMGPLGEGVGVNITVLSNRDSIDIGVIACRETVPDVWDIAEGIDEAIARLKAVAQERAAA